MIPKVVLDHIKLEKEKRQWKCSPRLTSLCLGIFSTQSAENTLFVRRECLASVGSFVLLLIHCLAHIAVDDLQQDSKPHLPEVILQGIYSMHRHFASPSL